MKKVIAGILTAVSLILAALMTFFILSTPDLSAALSKAILPGAAALIAAYVSGKLFSAETALPAPAPSRA